MNGTMKKCPVCGAETLEPRTERVLVTHNSKAEFIESPHSFCDTCGCTQEGSADRRTFKRAVVAFKKEVEGLLSGAEVRRIRESLDLTQAEAAALLGGGSVAFSKYEKDDVMQSTAMDRLLRVLDRNNFIASDLQRSLIVGPSMVTSEARSNLSSREYVSPRPRATLQVQTLGTVLLHTEPEPIDNHDYESYGIAV